MSKHHLTVYDFKDTDLMQLVDEAGESGTSAADLADGMGWNGKDGVRAIGMRFAWMRKFGMLDYDEKHHLWTVSDGGSRVIESHIRAASRKVIEALPSEAMIEHMAHITSVYRMGDPMVAALLRREFQYGTNPRSRVWSQGR
jgi:hypothetical protein